MAKKPTDLTPLKDKIDKEKNETISVQTNEIDTLNLVIDSDYFDSRFDFYAIPIILKSNDDNKEDEDKKKEDYKKAVIKLSIDMKKTGGIIASVHDKKHGCKVFMIKKHWDIGKKYEDNKTLASIVLPWNIHHLLCNGVDTLKNSDSSQGFTYETRYYHIIDYNKWKNQDVIEIRTVHVKLVPDWKVATSTKNAGNKLPLVLSPQTTTFTNIEAVENSNMSAKKKKKILSGEIFILTADYVIPSKNKIATNKESTISAGKFVKYTLKRSNNRIDAYHVDHKDLTDPHKSRAKVLFEHAELLNSVYGNAVKFNFKWYDFDTTYSYSSLNTAKEGEYKQIIKALQKNTIKVLNKSSFEINATIKKAINKICGEKHVIYGGDVCKGDSVLLFIDSAEEYKKSEKPDAYKQFKAKHPDIASQAIIMSTITEKIKVKPKYNLKLITDIIKNNKKSIIRVINQSEFEISDKKIKDINKIVDNKHVIYDGEPCKDDAVLLFIDVVSEENKLDILKKFKANYPHIDSEDIIISCIKETIEGEAILACDLAQLLVKQEILAGKFLIDRCKTPEDIWFIEPIEMKDGKPTSGQADEDIDEAEEEEDQDNTIDQFEYYRGIIIKERLIFSKLTAEEITELKIVMQADADLVFGKKKKDGSLIKNRNPMIYNPKSKEYMIFTKTGRSVIPDHDKNEKIRLQLVAGKDQKVGREWFISYANNPKSIEEPKAAIQQLLDKNPNVNAFDRNTIMKELKKGGCSRGGNRDEIPNLILEDLGIRWIGNAQKTSGKDLVSHQYGFNFSYENKVYYSGAVGSHDNKKQANFCTLYEITTNRQDLPVGMHEWFLSFSIRNKQTTVKPYFFKHIREYAKIDYWKQQSKVTAPVIVIENKVFDPVAEFASIPLS